MGSVAELQREADDLERQLKDLRAKTKEKRKLEACSDASVLRATPWMRAVAVRALALTENDVAVAEAYVRSKGRGEGAEEIRAWRAALPSSEAAALLRPPEDQPRSARQTAEARKFVKEHGLVSWIVQQNKRKSIAPTPGAVLRQASVSGGSEAVAPSRYRWLRRLMRRWGGRKRNLRGSGQLTAEALRRKDSPVSPKLRPQSLPYSPVSPQLPSQSASSRAAFPGRKADQFRAPPLSFQLAGGPQTGPAGRRCFCRLKRCDRGCRLRFRLVRFGGGATSLSR